MQDSWQNDYGVKMLGREWTGKTIFLAQSRKKEERPKVDDEVFAFIAASQLRLNGHIGGSTHKVA